MKSFNKLIHCLFLTIICLSLFNDVNAKRPDAIPKSMLKEGCIPWRDLQCPAKMNCYIDFKYAKYGQCACKQAWNFRMRPPKDDGNELSSPPHKDDCILVGSINILSGLIWFFMFYSYFRLTILVILTTYRIYKNGGMKRNSSSLALVLVGGACIGESMRHFVFFINRVGLDGSYYVNDAIYVAAEVISSFFHPWFSMECICTWFDLYEKSVSMSKRSSKLITVLRVLLRLFAIVQATMFIVVRTGIVGGSNTIMFIEWINNISLWTLLICNGICGPLISRVLCKNMKDVTNPNWKAAQAIRHTSLTYLICVGVFWLTVQFLIKTGLFADNALSMNNTTVLAMFAASLVQDWGWFHYLLYAHRRYLENYDTGRISQYFGFTTIGLNGSRISSISGKSTTASSAASSVSAASVAAASTAEDNEGNDKKGTMA